MDAPPPYEQVTPTAQSGGDALQQRMKQAAAKNKELLRILSETDHAAAALVQQRRLVSDLEHDAAESDKRVAFWERKRLRELKEHEQYRDSVVRRLAFKATGQKQKFAARAEKEEREYFDALQREHREQDFNANLKQQLDAARKAVTELDEAKKRHEKAQKELNELYDAIFSGPTPGLPEEDERERRTADALREHHEIRLRAEGQRTAVSLLAEAARHARDASGFVSEALLHSRADMFNMYGGSSMWDMMERNALHKAENEIQTARYTVLQAQRMDPAVPDVQGVEINKGNLLGDVLFDNIFTDMAFHESIKRSGAAVKMFADRVNGILAEATERLRPLDAELERKEKALQEARTELQKIREAAFESV